MSFLFFSFMGLLPIGIDWIFQHLLPLVSDPEQLSWYVEIFLASVSYVI